MAILKAPFPWFGGKSKVAPLVWERFGRVVNYVEPFMGSLAMLLGRPAPWTGTETVNDADGMVSNFWRAVQARPDEVARAADWPSNENDLHARHAWLVAQREDITRRLEGDPLWCDPLAAGWWAWGQSCWIGSGWCAGVGPWHVVDTPEGPKLMKTAADGRGVWRQSQCFGDAGQGVHRKRGHLMTKGKGVHRDIASLGDYLLAISARLRDVRVCCGDWSRVCGPTPTSKMGLTGVFLDPPYADTAERHSGLYATDSLAVAHKAKAWAVQAGADPLLRIALCGYEGEHDMPPGWECVAWKAQGGYGSQGKGDNANARRERIWFSPHCLNPESRMPLFGDHLE